MEHVFPLITAHAGCMDTPPNSLENFLTGIDAGADIIEFDVNVTKDGVPILFHDQHVRISPHRSERLRDLTFEDLQELEDQKILLLKEALDRSQPLRDLQEPEDQKILRLEEGLDRVQPFRKTLNLDLKHPACLSPMADAVKFRNMVDEVILSGCHKEHALSVKQHYPEFQVLLNADEQKVPLSDSQYADYIKKTCRDAVEASCCGLNMHYRDFRREMLSYARLRCLPVLIYTVDDLREMKKLVGTGVHSITTNKVAALAALKARSK